MEDIIWSLANWFLAAWALSGSQVKPRRSLAAWRGGGRLNLIFHKLICPHNIHKIRSLSSVIVHFWGELLKVNISFKIEMSANYTHISLKSVQKNPVEKELELQGSKACFYFQIRMTFDPQQYCTDSLPIKK